MKITEVQSAILDYLHAHCEEWVSPTEIGYQVGGQGRNMEYHSSWASPKLKKLVSLGLVERNQRGHYRFVTDLPLRTPNAESPEK